MVMVGEKEEEEEEEEEEKRELMNREMTDCT